MSRVNFIVPRLFRTRIFGGLLTVFRYANGLVELGHEVNVIPIVPSERPEWFDAKFRFVMPPSKRLGVPDSDRSQRADRPLPEQLIRAVLLRLSRFGPYSFYRASHLEW